MGSMPTMPSMSPSVAMARDLSMDPPLMYASTRRPRSRSAKFSGGPRRRAKAARGGASIISATTDRVPAMKEPTAAMASAAPARPFRAIA
jgi:hypothetical protein